MGVCNEAEDKGLVLAVLGVVRSVVEDWGVNALREYGDEAKRPVLGVSSGALPDLKWVMGRLGSS